MKFLRLVLIFNLIFFTTFTQAQENNTMTREQLADQTFKELFAAERSQSATDPEFMEILQRFIFGEVFYVGNLTAKERELITVAALTALQTLPQLKAHVNAALNAGNSPLEIRETVYQAAPFIGFPRTLNAIGVFNEVMHERGIALPLENTATVTEENRFAEGLKIQQKLYGNEVKNAMQSLPEPFNTEIPDTLTKFCFADFYTRGGLDIRQRELLSLIILTAAGAEKQLPAHIIGNLKAGNDKNKLLAALLQAAPYIGLPNALTAVNLVKDTDPDNYQPIYAR